MPAWCGLLGVLVYNYSRHRRGRPTICAVTRRTLPRCIFMSAWAAFNAWFIPHVLRGYPRRPKESP